MKKKKSNSNSKILKHNSCLESINKRTVLRMNIKTCLESGIMKKMKSHKILKPNTFLGSVDQRTAWKV